MTNETQETTGWRPTEGDSISGTVADLTQGWSDQGKGSYYPIVTLKREDGSLVNVHAFHAVLQNRLKDIAPKLGDRLTITYKGKKSSKDGKREIAIYSVDAPDRVLDAAEFWQGTGAVSPNRSAGPQSSGATDVDVPIDDEDIPF